MADVCSIMFKYVKDSVKESLIPLAGLKSSTRGGTPGGAGGLLTCPRVQGASSHARGCRGPPCRAQGGPCPRSTCRVTSPPGRKQREKALVPEPVSMGFTCLVGWDLVTDGVMAAETLSCARPPSRLAGPLAARRMSGSRSPPVCHLRGGSCRLGRSPPLRFGCRHPAHRDPSETRPTASPLPAAR